MPFGYRAESTLLQRLQTYKGWFYVSATGLMLYLLIGRSSGELKGANEALRRNQAELYTVLNTIPALVFTTDADALDM